MPAGYNPGTYTGPPPPQKFDNALQERFGRPNAAWQAWYNANGAAYDAAQRAAQTGGGTTRTSGSDPAGAATADPVAQKSGSTGGGAVGTGGTKTKGGGGIRPGFWNQPMATWTPDEMAAAKAMGILGNQNLSSAAGSASASAAADLAERKREFNLTAQRDIAKENASEVDALQKLLLGMTGPKDPYAYTFFSRGLAPPQGYKPAGVPLTDAQVAAWKKANPGKSPADLQTTLTGGGLAPNWAQGSGGGSALGNMPQSMQTSNPSVNPEAQQAQQTQGPLQGGAAPNPAQAAQGVQNYMATPALMANPSGGNATKPVPSMAGGGQVPGPPGTPSLAVVHGGEEVTPAPGGPAPALDGAGPQAGPQMGPQAPSQGLSNAPGLHPAIAALVDAVSGLLQNPDFAPFVSATLQTNKATPGGAPSMAAGGTVPVGGTGTSPNPTGTPTPGGSFGSKPGTTASPATGGPPPQPAPTPTPPPVAPLGGGGPVGGAQGVVGNTAAPGMPDKPIMPLGQMDPYSRALYDIMGKLHPYSAQQENQMGPSGLAAVQSYVGKVEGVDVNDYTNLVDRLKPRGATPEAGSSAGEGFTSA